MCEPLRLDESLESLQQELGTCGIVHAARQFLKWLNKRVPFRLYYELPHGRRSVYSQLERRPAFPLDAWSEFEPIHEVIDLLKIIATTMGWPNYYFLPEDRLALLLIPDYDDFPWHVTFHAINRYFAVAYGTDDIRRVANEEWTLGQLVGDLLARLDQAR